MAPTNGTLSNPGYALGGSDGELSTDGSEGEGEAEAEDTREGMEDCKVLGINERKRPAMPMLVSPETNRKKGDDAPPAVRYSLRGGVQK